MARLLSLLRRRHGYRRLWLGEVVSALGDWLSYVALSVLVLDQGEGALALALVFVGHVLPTGLVAPLAGWLADRIERRAALVTVHSLQALLVVAMLLTASSGALGWTQLLLFARTTLSGLIYPLRQAALRQLVEPDELLSANTIDATTWSVTFSLGTALGGAIAMIDPLLALGLDALTFMLAAWLLRALPRLPPRDTPGRLSEALSRFRSDLIYAYELVRARPSLRRAALSKAPVAVAAGGGWLVMTLSADELLAGVSAAATLGALQALRGVGTGVGPLLADHWVGRGASATRLLRLATWLSLAAVAAFVLTQNVWLIAPIVVVWGMGSGANWVLSSSEAQRLSPPEASGRMAALEMVGYALGQSLVAIVAALLIDAGHARAAAGLLAVLIGSLLYLALLWRRGGAHSLPRSAMLLR